MTARGLGRSQRAVLKLLERHGSWHAESPWCYGPIWDMTRVLDTLVERGLVTAVTSPTRTTYYPVVVDEIAEGS